MSIRDRIKHLRRLPARELLGLVAGAWLAGFLLLSYLGANDGSPGGPIAGGIGDSVSGLLPLPRLRAAAQPGTGLLPLSPPGTRRGEWSAKTGNVSPLGDAHCEAGTVFLVRGAWNADDSDEFCLFPMSTHPDQVDAGSGACIRLAQGADTARIHGDLITSANAPWADLDPAEIHICGMDIRFDDRDEYSGGGTERLGPRSACVRLASYGTMSLRPIRVLFVSCWRASLRPVCVL